MQVLTKEEAREVDNLAIEKYKIPSIILMENAAKSSYDIIKENISLKDRICILCGVGNNGGDGFAIARHLLSNNYDVAVFLLGDKSKMSKETLMNLHSFANLGGKITDIDEGNHNLLEYSNYDVYIEALIGIGGSNNLRESVSNLLKIINKKAGFKIAIDVPAGLDCDTGLADDNAFVADLTITMFAPKVAMFLNRGRAICGKIEIAYLGIPQYLINYIASNRIIVRNEIRNILKNRDDDSSKFDYGRVLIIAGSEKYSGAASLCANACISAGAGLVFLATTYFHHSLFPEIMHLQLKENIDGSISDENFELLSKQIEKCDTLATGPGLGTNSKTISLVKNLIEEYPNKKIIFDADALLAINLNKKYNHNLVLTPHIFEFCRLINRTIEEIKHNEYSLVKEYAEKLNCNIHLKGVPSLTSDGKRTTLTIIGNAGMSSGGSGDVLTGIIAGLSAQGVDIYDASSLGAYLHAAAGDNYAQKYNKETLKASDIIENLKYCL